MDDGLFVKFICLYSVWQKLCSSLWVPVTDIQTELDTWAYVHAEQNTAGPKWPLNNTAQY